MPPLTLHPHNTKKPNKNNNKNNLQELTRALAAARAELAALGHVNKKALDQYVSFSEQRAELGRRRRELSDSEARIRDLISTLDLRKDEVRGVCRGVLFGGVIWGVYV